MDINIEIERLINYATQKNLIDNDDVVYMRNTLFDIFELEGTGDIPSIEETLDTPTSILEKFVFYAVEKGVINDNITEADLFTTRVMGILTPRPSEVIRNFKNIYNEGKRKATDYFYKLSKDNNYIMVDRVKKNIEWNKKTDFGDYIITINVSKPEKSTEEIRKAGLVKSSGYPKCLLCAENVGFAGNLKHPARQNLRTIPLTLNNEKWQMQYSPYVYYNEHCIIFNEKHTPMKITKDTFVRLLDFLDFLPHYFIGSNADLPIVGGSILSHDHFQGGNFELPMAKANVLKTFKSAKYLSVNLAIVNWPMSVIRLNGKDKNVLVDLSFKILEKWRGYSAESIDLISHTGDTPHNTITPIARVNKNGEYEIDLVLRNNRTSDEYPDGIFHTHKETHNVKKENIGLIEVMGLGVLPKRLIEEFEEIKKYLNGEIKTEFDSTNIHYDWVKYLQEKYGTSNNTEKLATIFDEEIGEKFASCLVDCGIFKLTENGVGEFAHFISEIGFI